jgi:hypothetical protein
MFVARWTIKIKFGKKDSALSLMRQWKKEVSVKAGFKPSQMQLLSGSIGEESVIEMNAPVQSLAELESMWAKMGKNPKHGKFSKKLEPLIVSGTNRWDILRVVD